MWNFNKFVKFILENHEDQIPNRDKMYSWLSPKGVWHPNNTPEYNDQHFGTAFNLVRQWRRDPEKWKYIQPHVEQYGADYIRIFQKMGYMRVSHYATTIHVNNQYIAPNALQRRLLIQLAQDANMEQVVYDNDRKERIIWTDNKL